MTGTVIGSPDKSIFKLLHPIDRTPAAPDELEKADDQKTKENKGELPPPSRRNPHHCPDE